MIEFVPAPATGRAFSSSRQVRLGDADPGGVLRLDGAARFLQDVAGEDWDATGLRYEDTFVVRRTAMRLAPGGHWPTLGDAVTLTTWCGGYGVAWAERRTTISLDGQPVVDAVALWVPVDPSGRPRRLRQAFFDIYAEAARGRRVSGRIADQPVEGDAVMTPWTIRRADLDVVGHVNNAALWCAASEVVPTPARFVSLSFHGAVEFGDDVTLASNDRHLWLSVGGDVRVSGKFDAG